MKKILMALSIMAALTLTTAQTVFADQHHNDHPGNLTTVNANLGSGIHVKIAVQVMENPRADRNGITAICVPGMGHTAESFKPLVRALFASNPHVRKVVLFDLPGHGDSGLPTGRHDVPYLGDLGISDYSFVTYDVLAACNNNDIYPSVMIGHSMGAFVSFVLEDELESCDSSLQEQFGIDDLYTLGAAAPGNVLDPTLESGDILTYLEFYYETSDPVLGNILSVDQYSFQALFFSDLSGQVVADAPSPEEIDLLGYRSAESATAVTQTVGPIADRPSVSPGIFSPRNGTRLHLLFGSQDQYSLQSVQTDLGLFLTGKKKGADVRMISSPDAVHDQFISNPEAVADALDL